MGGAVFSVISTPAALLGQESPTALNAGGPGTYAAPLARRGYRVHLLDPVPLHVEQARQAAGSDPAFGFTAAEGDARELAEPVLDGVTPGRPPGTARASRPAGLR